MRYPYWVYRYCGVADGRLGVTGYTPILHHALFVRSGKKFATSTLDFITPLFFWGTEVSMWLVAAQDSALVCPARAETTASGPTLREQFSDQ